MRLDTIAGPLHLTYCTNIHPGDGWPSVFANLKRYAPGLKHRLAPEAPFGLGLRLSAREARELRQGDRLDQFAEFLAGEGYVALINGFPYGPFHGAPVKAEVYAPDWRTDARAQYTLDLVDILSRLLPQDLDGGISTSPLSYKPWMCDATPADWDAVVGQLVQVAEAMVRLRQERGQTIHLDVEPEPDCVLETSAETIEFFNDRLLARGAPRLARTLGVSLDEAEEAVRTHVQICFDCCHFAVEGEHPDEALARLESAGLRVGRIQLSSALTAVLPGGDRGETTVVDRLRLFADATYLHQVVEHSAAGRRQFPDLHEALGDLANESGAAQELGRDWRVHFHVPLFTSAYEDLGSSQDYVRAVLAAASRRRITGHLEIETYTWDVLPGALKLELADSIHREYQWVLANLQPPA